MVPHGCLQQIAADGWFIPQDVITTPLPGFVCPLTSLSIAGQRSADPACLGSPDPASESTFERWRAQYGGMECEEAKRLKHLEGENRRLQQLVADQALDIQMLRRLAEGDW